MNPRHLSLPCDRCDFLPDFFVALCDRAKLQRNFRQVLDLLNVSDRGYVVALDETYWCPGYEICPSLGIVGGFYEPHNDCSVYDVSEWARTDPANLATMTTSFAVTRSDANGQVFDVNLVPMAPKSGKAGWMCQMLGEVLQAACSQHGLPPIGVAWDGGLGNQRIQALYLGMLPVEQADGQFWRKCAHEQVHAAIPLWGYKVLVYHDQIRKHYLLGNNDSLHVLKRMSLHLVASSRRPPYPRTPKVLFYEVCFVRSHVYAIRNII